MDKILYLMHVPWSWIKQRPQFLAEQLANYYHVTVIASEVNSDQKKELPEHLILKERLEITENKSGLLYKAQIYLRLLQTAHRIFNSKIIWVSYPNQYNLVKMFLTKKHFVVYDCMDDAVEFYEDPLLRSTIKHLERKLIKKSNLIICTSEHLRKVIIERHEITKPIYVVNNALKKGTSSSVVKIPENISSLFYGKKYKYLVYFGAISTWFDFELINKSLIGTNIKIIIFGPKEVEIPKNDFIIYGGILAHNQIEGVMMLSDALVMPFQLTQLILSVNPVKAYEYISSGKPVILVRYPETEKFENYAYLYYGAKEFKKLLKLLNDGNLPAKKDKDACHDFAKQNTWADRGLEIRNILNSMSEND